MLEYISDSMEERGSLIVVKNCNWGHLAYKLASLGDPDMQHVYAYQALLCVRRFLFGDVWL